MRINTDAEVKRLGIPKFEPFYLSSDFPIFTLKGLGECPLTTLVGIPLRSWRVEQQTTFDKNEIVLNDEAAFLHTVIDPDAWAEPTDITAPEFGWLPWVWQYLPAPVLVARMDQRDLEPFHVEALAYFCQHLMQPMFRRYLAILHSWLGEVADVFDDKDRKDNEAGRFACDNEDDDTATEHSGSDTVTEGDGSDTVTEGSDDDSTTESELSFSNLPEGLRRTQPPQPERVLSEATPLKFMAFYETFLERSIEGRSIFSGEKWLNFGMECVAKGQMERYYHLLDEKATYSEEQLKPRPYLAKVQRPWGECGFGTYLAIDKAAVGMRGRWSMWGPTGEHVVV